MTKPLTFEQIFGTTDTTTINAEITSEFSKTIINQYQLELKRGDTCLTYEQWIGCILTYGWNVITAKDYQKRFLK
jgi:hypothetical protein